MIFGVDIDGVLRDWVGNFNVVYIKHFPHHKDLVRPIDRYDWFEDYDFDDLGIDGFFKNYGHEIVGTADALPGAPSAFRLFKEIVHELGHEVYIVTRQSSKQAREETKKWLKIFDIEGDKLVIVNNFAHKWNYVDIMIDDEPQVLNSKPEGKVSIKVYCSYNINVKADFSIKMFKDINLSIIKKSIEIINGYTNKS